MRTSSKIVDIISSIMIVGLFLSMGLAGCSKASHELQVSAPPGTLGQNVTATQRANFAGMFSGKLAKTDPNAKVTVTGDANKTMVVTSAMVTQDFAEELVKSEAVIGDLRKMGFKRLILEDRNAVRWGVDLRN